MSVFTTRTQWRLVRLVVLALAVAVLASVAWLHRGEQVAHALVANPVALARGVYLLGWSEPAAVYLVQTSKGLVLIDSGLEADAALVIRQIAELGFDLKQLQAVLLTHVHADHSQGAARLRELTGARIYASRSDSVPLRTGGPREAFLSTNNMPNVVIHRTPVDVELAADETIDFGETKFVALAAPGHTTGSICYALERADLRALFLGDVIQHLGPGRRGSLGTYTAYLPPLFRGDARSYLASLRRLRRLPTPDLVLPGHPQMDDVPRSPHMSEQRWRALLDRAIAEMEQVLSRFATDGPSFLDGSLRELLPGLLYLGDISGFAVYALKTQTGLYVFDAPGGPGLVDFLAKGCVRWHGRAWKPRAVLLTSVDAEATKGLAALVQSSGCTVVAPRAGAELVRRLCPPDTRVLSENDLAMCGWFDVRAVPLAGRRAASLAYQVRWAGKTVLLSGRMPLKNTTAALQELERDFKESRDRVTEYTESLRCLAQLNPNLWLPAIPVNGQNANLYDDDWKLVLAKNWEMLEQFR